MTRVAKYRIDEWLSPAGVPVKPVEPRYPHNYGVALRTFETMVKLYAANAGIFGPHGPCRLVLTQTGFWERSAVCMHCGEAIWQDGTEPGRGIWLHRRQDREGMFRTLCVDDADEPRWTHAEPAGVVELVDQAAGERTAEHAAVTSR